MKKQAHTTQQQSDPKDDEIGTLFPIDTLQVIREATRQAAEYLGSTESLEKGFDEVARQVGRLELVHETAFRTLSRDPKAPADFQQVVENTLPAIEPSSPSGLLAGMTALEGSLARLDVDGEERDATIGGPDLDFGKQPSICDISINGFVRMLDAVMATTDGDVKNPKSRFWRQIERISSNVDAAESVVQLYNRAKAVTHGKRSPERFGHLLLVFAESESDRPDKLPGAYLSGCAGTALSSTDQLHLADIAAHVPEEQADVSIYVRESARLPIEPLAPGEPGPPIGPPDPGEPNPAPDDGPGGEEPPGVDANFDPRLCPTERNREKLRLAACRHAIHESDQSYKIDRIHNRNHDVDGRGCKGDTVVIHGKNFGSQDPMNSVHFSPYFKARATISRWSNTEIECTVPSDAETGNVQVCVHPEYPECNNVPACLQEAKDSDGSFTVIEEPVIHGVTVDGRDASNPVTIEACTDAKVHVDATATETRIKDEDGALIYSEMHQFRHRTTSTTFQESGDRRYTVEVESICGKAQQEIVIKREDRLALSLNGPLDTGEPMKAEVKASCPAPQGGLEVNLSVIQGTLSIPRSIMISEGQTRTSVTQNASGSCGTVTVEATASNHRGDTSSTVLYDKPVVDGVNPSSVHACNSFTVRISGNCFAGNPQDLAVKLISDNTTESLAIQRILGTPVGTEIEAQSKSVEAGNYQVMVESRRKVASNTPSLQVTTAAPLIQEFKNNNPVLPCKNATSKLSWRVSNVSRVILLDQDGSKVSEQSYSAKCGTRTDSEVVTVNKPPRDFTLEVIGLDGNIRETAKTKVGIIAGGQEVSGPIQVHNPGNSGRVYDIFVVRLADKYKYKITTLKEHEWMIVGSEELKDCFEYKLKALENSNLWSELPRFLFRSDGGPSRWNLPGGKPEL